MITFYGIREATGKILITRKAGAWCQIPYPSYPKGCTNYGKAETCPPNAPMVDQWFDLEFPHWFVVAKCDITAQAAKMAEAHPEWSPKQCANSRYWQGPAHKMLRYHSRELMEKNPGTDFTLRPEAMGVIVITTAKKLGIPIELKPNGTLFKISLVGYLRAHGQRTLGDWT